MSGFVNEDQNVDQRQVDGSVQGPGDEDKIRHRVLAVVLHIQEASWRVHGGIAFMTNMLLTKQQIHQARLTEHFTVFDAWRLTNTGRYRPGAPSFTYLPQLVSGQKQGFVLVYRSILVQAAMLAFNDIYLLLTAVMLVMIPSFLFLRGPKTTDGAGPQGELISRPLNASEEVALFEMKNLTSAARGEAVTNL
jgi:hypothetical protein